MRAVVNFLLVLGLIATLAVGGVVTYFSYTVQNPKTRATYDSNGKSIRSTDVNKDESYLYVKIVEPEYITQSEAMARYVKHRKIIMEREKTTYNSEQNDTTLNNYYSACASYESAKTAKENFDRGLFAMSMQEFFSTYFFIAALFFIALKISNKVAQNPPPPSIKSTQY